MTEHDSTPQRTRTLVTEDLLLVLFQPESGTIAGENTLFYVLAGGVLTDLVQSGAAEAVDAGARGILVRRAGDGPADPLLRPMHEFIGDRERGVQTILAACGPVLRAPALDRLVERGDLRRERRRVIGLFPSIALVLDDQGRRDALIAEMRAVLVDGAEPSERVASLIALVSASGTLPHVDRRIPWNGTTAARAQQIERGDGAASVAGAAVTRTMLAVVAGSVIAAAVVAGR